MLKDYTWALFIDMPIGNRIELLEKAQAIATEFDLRLECTTGTLDLLRATLNKTLER